jgi:hypothetical protein
MFTDILSDDPDYRIKLSPGCLNFITQTVISNVNIGVIEWVWHGLRLMEPTYRPLPTDLSIPTVGFTITFSFDDRTTDNPLDNFIVRATSTPSIEWNANTWVSRCDVVTYGIDTEVKGVVTGSTAVGGSAYMWCTGLEIDKCYLAVSVIQATDNGMATMTIAGPNHNHYWVSNDGSATHYNNDFYLFENDGQNYMCLSFCKPTLAETYSETPVVGFGFGIHDPGDWVYPSSGTGEWYINKGCFRLVEITQYEFDKLSELVRGSQDEIKNVLKHNLLTYEQLRELPPKNIFAHLHKNIKRARELEKAVDVRDQIELFIRENEKKFNMMKTMGFSLADSKWDKPKLKRKEVVKTKPAVESKEIKATPTDETVQMMKDTVDVKDYVQISPVLSTTIPSSSSSSHPPDDMVISVPRTHGTAIAPVRNLIMAGLLPSHSRSLREGTVISKPKSASLK